MPETGLCERICRESPSRRTDHIQALASYAQRHTGRSQAEDLNGHRWQARVKIFRQAWDLGNTAADLRRVLKANGFRNLDEPLRTSVLETATALQEKVYAVSLPVHFYWEGLKGSRSERFFPVRDDVVHAGVMLEHLMQYLRHPDKFASPDGQEGLTVWIDGVLMRQLGTISRSRRFVFNALRRNEAQKEKAARPFLLNSESAEMS